MKVVVQRALNAKVEIDGKIKKIITGSGELKCKYLVIATGRLSKKLFYMYPKAVEINRKL